MPGGKRDIVETVVIHSPIKERLQEFASSAQAVLRPENQLLVDAIMRDARVQGTVSRSGMIENTIDVRAESMSFWIKY